MKLLSVHIENFKSLKELDIKLDDRINLLIGKNNSGKSNFIEALLFLPKIIEGNFETKDFERIMYGKDMSKELGYELLFSLSEDEKMEFISNLPVPYDTKKEINQLLGSEIKYIGKFNVYKKIVKEDICVFFDNKEIVFSRGYWEGNKYYSAILEKLSQISKSFDWKDFGGGGIAVSILQYPSSLPKLVNDFLNNIHNLSSSHSSNERKTVRGYSKLNSDGSNLPELLHSLATSNRKCFDTIIEHTKDILENILEIRTPIIEGSQDTYIAIVEEPFEDIEYTWNNMSSGTKEIIFQITLLNSSKKESLLIIEEPEIHLHGGATRKFIDILKKVAERDDKQIIITTHSPIFIDMFNQKNLFCVVKKGGNTNIIPLSQEIDFEGALTNAGLSRSDLFISQSPSFIVIVEGRDDFKILNQFLIKEGIDPQIRKINIVTPSEKGGGVQEAIRFGRMLKRTRIEIPFLIILDSDRIREEREQKIKEQGFKEDQYVILQKEEIEDYLIDGNAIGKVVGKPSDEIERIISVTKGTGKEKLERILKELRIEPNGEIKALIVRHLETTPEDIKKILAYIESKIS